MILVENKLTFRFARCEGLRLIAYTFHRNGELYSGRLGYTVGKGDKPYRVMSIQTERLGPKTISTEERGIFPVAQLQ